MTRINLGLSLSYVKLLLSSWENIFVQFEGKWWGFIRNCALTRTGFLLFFVCFVVGFFFCYKRDFMSNIHKFVRYDPIDMFNYASWYLDDLFTIDDPEFKKHILDKYLTDLQFNQANTSIKEALFFDLNIQVIVSDIHTSITTNAMTSDFLLSISPWLNGDVPRLPSYDVYISHFVRFTRCCIIERFGCPFQGSSGRVRTTDTGLQMSQPRETFGKFFESYSGLLSRFGEVSFQEYVFLGGNPHPIFYVAPVYKFRRVKCEANFVSSDSEKVKRLTSRKYDPGRYVLYLALLRPFTDLSKSIAP